MEEGVEGKDHEYLAQGLHWSQHTKDPPITVATDPQATPSGGTIDTMWNQETCSGQPCVHATPWGLRPDPGSHRRPLVLAKVPTSPFTLPSAEAVFSFETP